MIDLGLAPEPLAFRVRPLPQECFDSWIERLATAHETDRRGLFGHLGIVPTLASLDLARGYLGLDPVWHEPFAMMVERLAWAVQVKADVVQATCLGCAAAAVLPRRWRCYACARCWYAARHADKPLIILKEWILRASWRCWKHGVPLSDMSAIISDPEPARLADLFDRLAKAMRVYWKMPARPKALHHNGMMVAGLAYRGAWQGIGAHEAAYHARFAGNAYHIVPDRIAMLALAHSSRSHAARDFERLLTAPIPARPTPGGGWAHPGERPYRCRPGFMSKPESERLAPDFLHLLQAYGEACARRDHANALAALVAQLEGISLTRR
jgi:hypothetical protein